MAVQALKTAIAKSPINFGLDPVQGPVVIMQNLDFTGTPSIDVDLGQFIQDGSIEFVQTLWIDNSQNTAALAIFIPATGQTLRVLAKQQAYLSAMFTADCKCTVSTTQAAILVQLGFMNVDCGDIVWQGA
jgi:hypothetical protein